MENTSKDSGNSILSGIITGQIAGLIMAVVVMAVFWIVLGKSPLYPVQVIGSTVFGAAALEGFHLGALIAGLVIHQLGPSLFWGAVYGFVAKGLNITSAGAALLFGLVLGAVTMIDAYLLVPMLMNRLHGVDYWNQEVPMFWDWAAHLIFGASFVLYPTINRWLSSRSKAAV